METKSQFQISQFHVQEIKALLHSFPGKTLEGVRNELTFFSFMPTRTLTWHGSIIAYKVSPLLCDAKGYLTIRLSVDEVESLMDAVSRDKDFRIDSTDATFLMHPSVKCYHISLDSATPVMTPMPSPRFDVYRLPMDLEERVKCDYDEIEEVEVVKQTE